MKPITLAVMLVFTVAFSRLTFAADESYQVRIAPNQPVSITHLADRAANIPAPLMADIIDQKGAITRVVGTYSKVENTPGKTLATGELTTTGGTLLDFSDVIEISSSRFSVDRTVTVHHTSPEDRGFRTEFNVYSADSKSLADVQPFLPGVWYCDANHVPPSGLVTDPNQENYLLREDRLAIPLAMIRNRSTNSVLSIRHDHPDGGTFPAENTADVVVDERVQFASLGLVQHDGMAVAIAFPGIEGDESHVGARRFRKQPSQRFHPAKDGFSQHYQFTIALSRQTNFDEAMQETWRNAYAAFSPPIVSIPMDRVYANSIDVLDHYGADHNGIPGFPFDVTLPSGEVHAVSYQMGFVGEQLPCAYHLITAGIANSNPKLTEKGERIVDFWAANCLNPQGLPRVWYDVDPKPHWRKFNTFTRIATDGMLGMLQAWRREKLSHHDKPAWLQCCQKYGQWLIDHQNPDGSYCRQYDDESKPVIASKSATLQPVRFLIDLYNATGDERYLTAAKRAGEFGKKDIADNTNYYGGTADNNDVKDKEAGWIALDSFLVLFEATDDKAWLAPAVRAATFTETWTYCWNVPIDHSDRTVTFPKIKTTAGTSLIATGHSATDVFLAFAPYAYYRLALYTHDSHFADVAKLLLYNTRQLVDVDRSLGYGRVGLLTEAFNLAPPRGHGVNVWLPWCTASVLDPMQQLQDTFGSMDLGEIEKLPTEKRLEMLKNFSAHHGFPLPEKSQR